MNQDNTKSVEIDVLALLHKLWTKKLLILFTAFYFAAFSFLGTYFFIQPTYTSTTRIYVVIIRIFLLKICKLVPTW